MFRALYLTLLTGFSLCAFAQNASLDSSFATNGKLTLDTIDLQIGRAQVHGFDDGGMVLLVPRYGSINSIQVLGLDSIGDLDISYGNDGTVEMDFPSSGGFLRSFINNDEQLYILTEDRIRRMNRNGSVDSTFAVNGDYILGYGGMISADISPFNEVVFAYVDSGNGLSTLQKLDVDGGLDTNFASSGQNTSVQEFDHVRIDQTGEVFVTRKLSTGTSLYSSLTGQLLGQFSLPFSVNQDLQSVNQFGEPYYLYNEQFGAGVSTNGVIKVELDYFEPVLGVRIYNTNAAYKKDLFFQDNGGAAINLTTAGNPYSSAIDQFGDLIVASYKDHVDVEGWRISKLKRDLTNDTTFGVVDSVLPFKTVRTVFDAGIQAFPTDVEILSDGRFLVAGYSNGRPVVARYFNNISDPRSKISLKVMLGGAMHASLPSMNALLLQDTLIPLETPYALTTLPGADHRVLGFAQPGQNWQAYLSPELLSWTGDSAIVDWIWLELVDVNDTENIFGTLSALVRTDGQVVTSAGEHVIDWSVGNGPFFIRIKHRNHFSVMNADPLSLSDTITFVDFSNPATNTFGSKPQATVNGVEALYAGDVNTDGVIKYLGSNNDRDSILVAIGGFDPTAISRGYSITDVNLDGQTKYLGAANDRDIILLMLGGANLVQVFVDQTP